MPTQPILLSHSNPNVMETNTLSEFSRIQDASVEAVILNRKLPSAVAEFLGDTLLDREKGERFFVPLDEIPTKAAGVLGALGLAEGIARSWLVMPPYFSGDNK